MCRNARNGGNGENLPKSGEYVMAKQRVPIESGDFGENGDFDENGEYGVEDRPLLSVNLCDSFCF